MDRRTYDLLSKRVSYLEWLTNIQNKTSQTSILSKIEEINKSIKLLYSHHPKFDKVHQLSNEYNLWEEETQEIEDLEEKKLLIVSNEESIHESIKLLGKLSNLQPNELINNRFPSQVINDFTKLKKLSDTLSQSIKEVHNPLIVNSMMLLQNYVEIIQEYNETVSHIRKKLQDKSLQKAQNEYQEQKKNEPY